MTSSSSSSATALFCRLLDLGLSFSMVSGMSMEADVGTTGVSSAINLSVCAVGGDVMAV